jgi:hypothetical protein
VLRSNLFVKRHVLRSFCHLQLTAGSFRLAWLIDSNLHPVSSNSVNTNYSLSRQISSLSLRTVQPPHNEHSTTQMYYLWWIWKKRKAKLMWINHICDTDQYFQIHVMVQVDLKVVVRAQSVILSKLWCKVQTHRCKLNSVIWCLIWSTSRFLELFFFLPWVFDVTPRSLLYS